MTKEEAKCRYCTEDFDGYVCALSNHAYVYRGKLELKAKGWRGTIDINYCPMCGRKLKENADG